VGVIRGAARGGHVGTGRRGAACSAVKKGGEVVWGTSHALRGCRAEGVKCTEMGKKIGEGSRSASKERSRGGRGLFRRKGRANSVKGGLVQSAGDGDGGEEKKKERR